jgi:transposase InsO family protein
MGKACGWAACRLPKAEAVTDLRKDAAHRYSPAAVVAVAREAAQGVPAEISTSYVERSELTIRMESRRFTRLTNGFSKKLDNHAAAVSLFAAHYNWCRVHEALIPNVRQDGLRVRQELLMIERFKHRAAIIERRCGLHLISTGTPWEGPHASGLSVY